MSKKVEALVWERSRAGKSDLLLLVKIADLCPQDDGLNCYAEVPYLSGQIRATERGTEYVLRRLLDDGEIEIEYNDGGQEIRLRSGRMFRPKWFIHVRCVCDWDAYQREADEPAKIADSPARLRAGRPKRKSANFAGSETRETRKVCTTNAKEVVEKPEKTGSAHKEGSVFDPLVEQEQGSAAPRPVENRPEENPDDNLGVITKLAHEAFDVLGNRADLGAIAEAVKSRCATLKIKYYPGDVVRRAIDSAKFQRTRFHSEVH